jgi:vacuolar-type H+-ATPase subunit H
MKMFFVLMLFVFVSCQDDVTSVEPKVVKKETSKLDEIIPAEEDCDDKFEKAKEEEKKIDEDNLFGQKNEGDEGCTIE